MTTKIYYINLDTSSKRGNVMDMSLKNMGLPFERVAGVEGKSLSSTEISRQYDKWKNFFTYVKFLSRGEIGCYLSHKKAWRKFLDDGADFGVILEDDVIPHTDFPKFIANLESSPFDFDCLKLIAPGRKKHIVNSADFGDWKIVKWLKPPTYAAAYILSRRGAEKLLNSRKHFGRPVDVDIQYFWESDLRVLGVVPDMFSFNDDSEVSTITTAGRKSASITFPFARAFFEILYYIKAHFIALETRKEDILKSK